MNRNKKSPFSGYLSRKVRNKVSNLLASVEGIILDVACGNGLFFLEHKTDRSVKFIGVDILYKLLSEAKTNKGQYNVSLALSDAFVLPFKKRKFDAVLCLNTTINLKSKQQLNSLILELTTNCSPNGRIIIDIRNSDNVLMKIKYAVFSLIEHFPLQSFSIDYVQSILKKTGFEVKKIEAVGIPQKRLAWGYIIVAEPMKL